MGKSRNDEEHILIANEQASDDARNVKGKSTARRVTEWTLLGLHLVATILLAYVLIRFPILPTRYMILGFAVMALLYVLSAFLLKTGHKRFVCGIVMSVLLIACYVVAFSYLEKTRSTLDDISGVDMEHVLIDNMLVIVREEDAAQTVKDTLSYVYGIQNSQEYDDSLAVVQYIQVQHEAELSIRVYESYTELAQALLAGEVQAIVMNESFLVMLEEYEEGFADGSRVLETLSFEAELPKLTLTATPIPSVTEPPVEVTPEPTKPPEATPTPTPEGPTATPTNSPTPTPTRVPVVMPPRADKTDVTKDYFVVYCSGIDTDGAINKKSRSDVNILMVVNPTTKKILLVNTPRDSYVTIPGITGGSFDKLTHAGIYGVKYSMKALENLYGIPVDYYMRVNFTSVKKFVDLLGGVDVYSAYEFSSGGVKFNKGYNHLNGTQALVFARERKAFAAGDNQRGKNQMELIKAVIAKMTSSEALLNFGGIMDQVRSNFQTDLSMNQLTSLVRAQLNNPSRWTVESYAVTGSGTNAYCYSYKGKKLYVTKLSHKSVNEAVSRINKVISGQ